MTPTTSRKLGPGARMARTSPCSSTSPERRIELGSIACPDKRSIHRSSAFQTAPCGFCYSENDMNCHWKNVCFGLRPLFLSLALLLGGVAIPAQEASVTPPPADSKPAPDADFIAAADEVLGQMSQITGLKLVTPLKKSLRSREEIRAYVIKQMNEEKNAAERYADQRSAEAFGLLPKRFDLDSFMVIGDLGSTPTLEKAPPFLKDALIFPYIGGLNFSAAVIRNVGWSALPAVFEKPPVSTQQILHPALYRSGKTPVTVTLPQLEKLLGNNWSKLDENIMGEFGWKEVLKQFLDNDRAKNLAASWEGDRYAVFEQKQTKKLILVSRLRVDSEVHAARFFGQYSEALEKKYAERSNLLRRPNFFSFDAPDGGVFLDCLGLECVTLEGTTRDKFDAFIKALDWPLAPQPPEKPGSIPAKTAMIPASGENIVATTFAGLS